jgi:hypothetical protein
MPVGLCLEDPTRARVWDYASTPVDSTTFGSTGGDGVHFSVLHTGRGNGYAPVAMTVPMAFDAPNHIVGGILREFLALGCRTGYRCLERLVYRWGRSETIARLCDGLPPADAGHARLLQHLAREFALKPCRQVKRRLGELDTAYRPQLRPRQNATPS